MNNTTIQGADPDFSKFKHIPPAFAGTIIDWSMGSREITATVIDLVLRDYLSVIDSNIIRNKKNSSLRNFESKFINVIFGQNEILTFKQFSQIAFKKEFDNLLKIIADGMMEEGFIDRNFQKTMADAVKQSIGRMPIAADKSYAPVQSKNTRVIIIPQYLWVIIGIIVLIVAFIIPFLLIFIIPLCIFLIVLNGKIRKKLGKSYDWMLTAAGKYAKNESVSLYAYMEQYPLLEDRLANELASFAIAFGLGKRWINNIGKFNADLKLFAESMDSQINTVYRFMDFDAYLKEFTIKK